MKISLPQKLSLQFLKVKFSWFVLSISIFLFFNNLAVSQTWQWAKSASGTGGEEGWSVSADASGNAFITGFFNDPTVTFGSNTLTNIGSGYTTDVFLAKYDATGNVLWAQRAGGTSSDVGYSVSADAGGNVFVTGGFGSPTITFGSSSLINAGDTTVFLAKYDANGNALWAKSAGGTSADEGYSVSSDAGGNVFVTGYFKSPTITFGSTILTNAGDHDVFLAKYDANGNTLWAKSSGGTGLDEGYSLSADAAGNVFVTGYFKSPTITFGSTTLINAGSGDVFLAKYDANGNVLWAKSAGGTSKDKGYSVSADAGGNVFLTGYFNSPTITFGSTILTNAGLQNFFLAKYDANGNVLWATSAGGTNGDGGYSVSADAGGNAFVSGYFNSPTITFGSTTLTHPPNPFTDPMFIVKYDAAGNVLCASSLESGSDDNNAISTDPFGNAYIVGDFQYVDPFIVGSDALPLTGVENIFVAKYSCGNILSASISHTDAICSWQCTGTATATPTGGNSPYSYLWNTTPVQTTQTAIGLCEGNYSVTVTDALSGTVTQTVTITQPTAIVTNISALSNLTCNSICNGSASVYASGGNPAYTYSWNCSPIQTTANATGLCAGNYTCTIADANLCPITATVTITQPSAINAGVNTTQATCGNNDGTATITASGGTGTLTYLWTGGGSTATINNLSSGTYTVTVTDASGCTQIGTGNVGGSLVSANAGLDMTIVWGTSTVLNGSGPIGATFNWTPSSDLSCSTCATPTATPNQTTTYILTVTYNGCSLSDTVTVFVDQCTGNEEFTVPNAFSPNNDGHNDLFTLQGWANCVSTFSFIIFDRWGEKVFETEDISKGWDGTINGTQMNPAVFVYIINATLNNGEKISKKGNISLIH